eukprot:6177043-Pleurochrysis_carterae.AAC.5
MYVGSTTQTKPAERSSVYRNADLRGAVRSRLDADHVGRVERAEVCRSKELDQIVREIAVGARDRYGGGKAL